MAGAQYTMTEADYHDLERRFTKIVPQPAANVNPNVKNSDRDTTDQTETEAFKRWFGDSKVVNEDGTPKVVYHQTGANFSVFNTDNPVAGLNDSETPNGIFFKDNDHDIGLGGQHQMAVYLKAENILHFENRQAANAWYQKNVPGYAQSYYHKCKYAR